MEKKNVVRTPFGQPKESSYQSDPKPQESNSSKPPSFVKNQTVPPKRIIDETPTSTNPPKNNKPQQMSDSMTGSQMISKEREDISSKEYESIKNFNCSRNFLKTTADKLPANSIILKEASFPIGLVINPFSVQEGDLPTVNYGEKEIPRCNSSQCRAYINPFVKWSEGGEKWTCNLCKNINQTEDYYYGKLDKYGNRADLNERPDLQYGSYEFIANRTYMKKDKLPNNPNFIFVIDVSLASSNNNFLSAVLESIKDTINSDSISYPERTKVAFITYDTSVHFYCLNKKLTQPQMLCVSDDNIFLPTTPDSLLVPLDSSKKIALTALDLIQTSYLTNTCKDSNKIFTAINAAYLLAKGQGGKIIVFSASQSMTALPKMKSNSTIVNIPKDEVIYTATDEKQLSTMGINLTNENISCDLFVTSESYVNLITLNQICDYTNGNLFFYKNFRLEAHYKNIFNQIRRVLTRMTGLEAVVRTRFSRGYKISTFLTPVLISNGDLMICSTLDSDQSYTVNLDVADQETVTSGIDKSSSLINDQFVYMQTAALYTHPDGTRRIRIHNLCLPIASRLSDIYESIDVETLAVFYMKSAIDKIFKTKKISNSVLSTEASYKSFVSAVLSIQQSLKKELPDNLVYLPLYLLGVLKHRVCCKDELERKFDIDLSNYLRIKIQRMNHNDIMAFIYPRIYPLHQLLYDTSLGNQDEYGNITSTYMSSLESDGVYLIDNGFLLIIYTKLQADPRIIKSIFGVDDLSLIQTPLFEDVVFNDPDENKQKIMNMVDYIRGSKSLFQNLIFVFESTDGERIVKESLIEDNFCPWMTVDFKTFYANTVESGTNTGYRPGMR